QGRELPIRGGFFGICFGKWTVPEVVLYKRPGVRARESRWRARIWGSGVSQKAAFSTALKSAGALEGQSCMGSGPGGFLTAASGTVRRGIASESGLETGLL